MLSVYTTHLLSKLTMEEPIIRYIYLLNDFFNGFEDVPGTYIPVGEKDNVSSIHVALFVFVYFFAIMFPSLKRMLRPSTLFFLLQT